MFYDVVEAKIMGELIFWVRFSDGVNGHVRFLNSYLYGVFEKLKNPDFFNQLQVVDGFVCWGDELDLAPDSMYKAIVKQGEWILGNDKTDYISQNAELMQQIESSTQTHQQGAGYKPTDEEMNALLRFEGKTCED